MMFYRSGKVPNNCINTRNLKLRNNVFLEKLVLFYIWLEFTFLSFESISLLYWHVSGTSFSEENIICDGNFPACRFSLELFSRKHYNSRDNTHQCSYESNSDPHTSFQLNERRMKRNGLFLLLFAWELNVRKSYISFKCLYRSSTFYWQQSQALKTWTLVVLNP